MRVDFSPITNLTTVYLVEKEGSDTWTVAEFQKILDQIPKSNPMHPIVNARIEFCAGYEGEGVRFVVSYARIETEEEKEARRVEEDRAHKEYLDRIERKEHAELARLKEKYETWKGKPTYQEHKITHK